MINLKKTYQINSQMYKGYLKWCAKYVAITMALYIGMLWMENQNIQLQYEASHIVYAQTIGIKDLKKNMTDAEYVWHKLDTEYSIEFSEMLKSMDITQCESHRYRYAINKNKDGSYDCGFWQINERVHKKRVEEMYHRDFRDCAFDLDCSTDYAMYLYKTQGFNPWVCSKLVK